MTSEESKIQNPKSKIGVLLVDDSPLALAVLKRILAASPEIEVVGTAQDGKEALKLVPKLEPTVICTDLHMPVMDGLVFTKEVMADYPTPILVVSASVSEGSANVFNLLEAGAIDVFHKPKGGLSSADQTAASELIRKIRILSGVKVFRRHPKKEVGSGTILDFGLRILDLKEKAKENVENESHKFAAQSKIQIPKSKVDNARIVVIGASTGGPQALQVILPQLPAAFPLPVICVQHISNGFISGMVEWLAAQCRLKVGLAQAGEAPLTGNIYFPQEDTHLGIDGSGKFTASVEAPGNGHRPSITVTMRSVAQYYGSSAAGVLLTGMGSDGAEGMKAIADAGGLTIAQDENSSVVFGMPKQAIELGAARYVMPLQKIAEVLIAVSGQHSAFKMEVTNG